MIESQWVYLTAKDLFKTKHFKIKRLDVSIYDRIQVQQLHNKKLKYKKSSTVRLKNTLISFVMTEKIKGSTDFRSRDTFVPA